LFVVGAVLGVTQLRDTIYVVLGVVPVIWIINAKKTKQSYSTIIFNDFQWPHDIVACERTSQVYVAGWSGCIWRVSSDGKDIRRWLWVAPGRCSLSVTSTRLLVTSRGLPQLIQFDAGGDELRRVQLPDDMRPRHAVESPTGTFIVSDYNRQVGEVNTGGEVLRQFSGSHLPSLDFNSHIAIDSRGNIFVADRDNHRIVLLDAHLTLRGVIIDEHQLNNMRPECLCYVKQSKQLLVGLYMGGVVAFDVLSR